MKKQPISTLKRGVLPFSDKEEENLLKLWNGSNLKKKNQIYLYIYLRRKTCFVQCAVCCAAWLSTTKKEIIYLPLLYRRVKMLWMFTAYRKHFHHHQSNFFLEVPDVLKVMDSSTRTLERFFPIGLDAT